MFLLAYYYEIEYLKFLEIPLLGVKVFSFVQDTVFEYACDEIREFIEDPLVVSFTEISTNDEFSEYLLLASDYEILLEKAKENL